MVFTRKNLDGWCERGILAIVLGMLVFAPLAFGAVPAWAFIVVQALALGVFGLWALRLWVDPKPKLLWPPLAWVALTFTVYAVARYFTSDIEYVARLEVMQVLLFAFLFFAVVNNLHGQEETTAISFTLIAVATGTACYAVAQLTQHSNHVWNQISPYTGRASGTYISPNNLSGLLAMLLPLALAYMLVGKVKIVTRIMLGYAALAMGVGLAVTFSRGGWIAASAGVLVLLAVLLGHRNHRLKAVILLVALLAGGGFSVSHYLSKTTAYMRRVASPNGSDNLMLTDGSFASRLEIWNATARMWEDQPWFGVGPAHFDYRFREYRPASIQERPDRAHNDYLNLLADWGIVGGVIVFAGMVIFFVSTRKTWPSVRRAETDFGTGQSNRFAFFLGAICGLTALAVHSMMDFNLHIPANALVAVTLLALVVSNVRFATERFWFRPRLPLKLVLTIALVTVIAYLANQEWRRAGETCWLARAAKLPNFSPERAAALEKAFACEPENFETAYEIGECYRTQSLNGEEGFAALAQKAMDWYARDTQLNSYDGYGFLRTGMCLDWLGQHGEKTEAAYRAAEARDPNGYFTVANIGWHYVQTDDYAAAQEWFIRSLKLSSEHNEIALNYLSICLTKLADKASGRPQLPSVY